MSLNLAFRSLFTDVQLGFDAFHVRNIVVHTTGGATPIDVIWIASFCHPKPFAESENIFQSSTQIDGSISICIYYTLEDSQCHGHHHSGDEVCITYKPYILKLLRVYHIGNVE